MDRIMHGTIDKVTTHKAGKEQVSLFLHDEKEYRKNNGGNDQRWYRGHEQPLFIAGKFMVNTMRRIEKFLGAGIL